MLTVPEAARRVGRNPETVRRWIRSGRLPADRVGTQHLVREDDLDEVASPTRLQLGPEWTTFDSGAPQPDWESVVRDQRRGH
jgi:excisionase family DNA binding protein